VKSWPERGLRPAAAIVAGVLTAAALAGPGSGGRRAVEAWVELPVPAQFHVESTELEGPVYADAEGSTLYAWPQHKQRNGYSGESPGTPACYDEVLTVTAGLMSPYPAGIELPDLDTRPSCTDLWPPVLAGDDASPVGNWSIVERRDGTRQWAYDEQPLYTSIRDSRPGDVLGGTKRRYGGDSPANRVPVGPPPKVPPGFAVKSVSLGRMLTTDQNDAVYAFDGDTADSTLCDAGCERNWRPILAPALAQPQGEWSLFERSPGVRQWVYRGKPLYTNALDQHSWSQQGSDVPGWNNVFTQRAPAPPAGFTVRQTIAGDVLADARGMTIYVYQCGDDSQDQLACDHPDDTQVYRLAMCGGGDPDRCLDYWPYVEAGEDAAGTSRTWSVMTIDPRTGHRAEPEQTDAIRVWAYRDRPVYTFAGDEKPGDVNGGGTGEWRGQRNGLRAFWLRDDFMGGIL
jgi:predicted lipoprotein with Yx(FWY)xxD motif